MTKLDFYKTPYSDFQEDMSHRIMNKSDRFKDIDLFEIAPSATEYPIKNWRAEWNHLERRLK